MSLTVSCLTCRDPDRPRRIVSWAQNCRACADLCVANHLAEFPDHRVELTGFEASARTPFGAESNIRRLFGQPRRSA